MLPGQARAMRMQIAKPGQEIIRRHAEGSRFNIRYAEHGARITSGPNPSPLAMLLNPTKPQKTIARCRGGGAQVPPMQCIRTNTNIARVMMHADNISASARRA